MAAAAAQPVAHTRRRLVYICDWLPPDYGAVGQYGLLFARERAAEGMDVVLAGLSSRGDEITHEDVGTGRLTTVKVRAQLYDKSRFSTRAWWTASTNTRVIRKLWSHLRRADEIVFTGSPPLFLHWIAPLNLLFRSKLTYRITDFYPECLMAGRKPIPLWLRLLYRLTLFWRRRVSTFEALGRDQLERLTEIGIARDRIVVKRDPSPVIVGPATVPLARPALGQNSLIMLYSGNWGVAHDYRTFVEGYRLHRREGSRRFILWLNAVGAAVGDVEDALRAHDLPFISGRPVPLEELASLLVTPDAHLITLSDEFVGYVLPSKVHGCIASGKPILFVGSARSDVHDLCSNTTGSAYARVDVGDAAGCAGALERLADLIEPRPSLKSEPSGRSGRDWSKATG